MRKVFVLAGLALIGLVLSAEAGALEPVPWLNGKGLCYQREDSALGRVYLSCPGGKRYTIRKDPYGADRYQIREGLKPWDALSLAKTQGSAIAQKERSEQDGSL